MSFTFLVSQEAVIGLASRVSALKPAHIRTHPHFFPHVPALLLRYDTFETAHLAPGRRYLACPKSLTPVV
jgi:hypothetical protein